jgi:hypothetical protein
MRNSILQGRGRLRLNPLFYSTFLLHKNKSGFLVLGTVASLKPFGLSFRTHARNYTKKKIHRHRHRQSKDSGREKKKDGPCNTGKKKRLALGCFILVFLPFLGW